MVAIHIAAAVIITAGAIVDISTDQMVAMHVINHVVVLAALQLALVTMVDAAVTHTVVLITTKVAAV